MRGDDLLQQRAMIDEHLLHLGRHPHAKLVGLVVVLAGNGTARVLRVDVGAPREQLPQDGFATWRNEATG